MASNGFLRAAVNAVNITNIPWTVSRHELALYFSQFGHVVDSFVMFDKQTGFHEGYGRVTFLKSDVISTVLNRKHFLEGKNIIVSKKYNDNKDESNNQNNGTNNGN